jgi:translation elongation factor P/translation initiation factor 5A
MNSDYDDLKINEENIEDENNKIKEENMFLPVQADKYLNVNQYYLI